MSDHSDILQSHNMDEQQTPAKVILWCTPRSLSTAITKCLSFVPNTDIWFEPFVDAYRFGPDAQYPESVVGSMVDYNLIEQDIPPGIGYDVEHFSYMCCKQQLENSCSTKKNVFVKAMAYAIDGRYDAIPIGYKHTFLIRHPAKVIRSWKKAIYNISDGPYETFELSSCPPSRVPSGLFFKESYNLYNYIKAQYDPNPVIIDSDDLLMNPSGVLEAYCTSVGIPYNKELLQWETSSDIIKTWNISRKNLQLFIHTFYATALSSSEFMKPKQMTGHCKVSRDDQRCVDFCMPFYTRMLANKLRV